MGKDNSGWHSLKKEEIAASKDFDACVTKQVERIVDFNKNENFGAFWWFSDKLSPGTFWSIEIDLV